ncbi:hypothetical protein [Chitinophaga cymbidii]|uniref:hypothetical protein n=1 Tax=Chitinophaga cymbidii TaxID=1096750 RepID=UPI0011BD86F2|nr:hypothetical protein [Chitinophaga cymbidii]
MDYLDDFDDAVPSLYSRTLVFLYSFCLTPLGGAVLMSINLIKVKKPINIIWLVIIALFLEIGHLAVMAYFDLTMLTFFIPLLLGAILLAFPVWNMLLKRVYYKKKKLLVPTIILVLIWLSLVILNFIDFTGQ